jgi:hypothetical protein
VPHPLPDPGPMVVPVAVLVLMLVHTAKHHPQTPLQHLDTSHRHAAANPSQPLLTDQKRPHPRNGPGPRNSLTPETASRNCSAAIFRFVKTFVHYSPQKLTQSTDLTQCNCVAAGWVRGGAPVC